METQNALTEYIWSNLQAGVSTESIAQQLRTAGWQDDAINQAFALAQQHLQPQSPSASPLGPTVSTAGLTGAVDNGPTPNNVTTSKRGRTRTGWLLFKQSMRLLTHHKQLTYYPLLSFAISFALFVIVAIVFIVDAASGSNSLSTTYETADGTTQYNATVLGMAVGLIYSVITAFISFIYTAALSAHVLDLFHAKEQPVGYYVRLALHKWRPILAFSLINTTVGILIRMVEQRVRFVGWILARILGVIWSLATLFVLPNIVETDDSAITSIKKSVGLFKSSWGENIIGRASFGGVWAILYLIAFFIEFVLGIMLISALQAVGAIIMILLIVLTTVFFGIVASTASAILNTALYYWARYRQVPGVFDANLLNQVFIAKKPR